MDVGHFRTRGAACPGPHSKCWLARGVPGINPLDARLCRVVEVGTLGQAQKEEKDSLAEAARLSKEAPAVPSPQPGVTGG